MCSFPVGSGRSRRRPTWATKKTQTNGSCAYHLLHLSFSQGYNLYMQMPSRPYPSSGLSSRSKFWANRSLVLVFGIAQSQTNMFLAKKSRPEAATPCMDLGVGTPWWLWTISCFEPGALTRALFEEGILPLCVRFLFSKMKVVSCQNGSHQKDNKQVLTRRWIQGNPCALLVEL